MEALVSGVSSVLTWLVHTTLYISILICLILLLKAITRRKLPGLVALWPLVAPGSPHARTLGP